MFILLNETLQNIRARLQINNIQAVNERNTERVFVAPILQAIDWNIFNLNDVVAEYDPNLKQGSTVTYALCSDGEPLLLVEVLPLFSDVTNKRAYAKVLNTLKLSKASYLAITNGVHWLVYNKDLRTILYIDIKQDKADTKLGLLRKSSLKEGILEEYIISNPIDKEKIFVRKELKARGYRLSDKTHKRLNELKRKITAYRQIKDQDISVSLIMECVLEEFLNNEEKFNYKEIPNETILKARIQEVFENNAGGEDQ